MFKFDNLLPSLFDAFTTSIGNTHKLKQFNHIICLGQEVIMAIQVLLSWTKSVEFRLVNNVNSSSRRFHKNQKRSSKEILVLVLRYSSLSVFLLYFANCKELCRLACFSRLSGGGVANPTAPLALLACGFNCTLDALGGDMILINDGELSVLDCG